MTESSCAALCAGGGLRQCPVCGVRGESVERLTVAALTSGVVPPDQRYALCRQTDCEVVYFGEDGTVISGRRLNVVPGFKSRSPEALVCYCFQHRRADLEAELAGCGTTTIPDRIAAEVKAGNCACEVRNPSGRCCLGDVQEVIQKARALRGSRSAQKEQQTLPGQIGTRPG